MFKVNNKKGIRDASVNFTRMALKSASFVFLKPVTDMFSIVIQVFPINDFKNVCDRDCINNQPMTQTVFSKASEFPTNDSEKVCEKEHTFSFKLRVCLAFAINGSEGAWDGVCFQIQVVAEFIFDKTSGFYWHQQGRSL